MRSIKIVFLAVVMLFFLQSCDNKNELAIARTSIIALDGTGEEIGLFYATYENGVTSATVSLTGMPAGSIHAVHLHDGTCDNIGMHWNQGLDKSFCGEESMGKDWGKPYAGDFENIYIDNFGTGSRSVATNLWTIGTGSSTDIDGKLVVVHAMASDFVLECDPTHIPGHMHINPKIGCGVIGY